jgi:hypothetical protein
MIRIVFLLLTLAYASVSGADEISIEPQTSSIASPLTIRLTVELKQGEKVEFPEKIYLPDDAILNSRMVHDPVSQKDGSSTQTVEYEIKSFAIGAGEIVGVDYTVVEANGERHLRVSGPVIFEIITIRDDSKNDMEPKDIKSPTLLSLKLSRYILPALVTLLVLFLLIYLWRRFYSDKKRETEAKVVVKQPHEIAYDQLNALKEDDPYGKGLYKEHYFRLSEIMRGYLERRYGLLALERTTHELQSEFDNRFETEQKRGRLLSLLEACDLVKFANFKSTSANAADSLQRAFEWVDLTKKDYGISAGSSS